MFAFSPLKNITAWRKLVFSLQMNELHTEKLLENRLGKQVLVRVQEPVRLNDLSEPEPDIAVLIPDPLYYEDHHPTPSEVYLIIEVADTSRERDLNFKAGIYAQSGIADYIMSGRLPLIKIERASPCHRSPKSFLTMGV
jgi:Putative restriction endonuclease